MALRGRLTALQIDSLTAYGAALCNLPLAGTSKRILLSGLTFFYSKTGVIGFSFWLVVGLGMPLAGACAVLVFFGVLAMSA
jgi:hypothetical protein